MKGFEHLPVYIREACGAFAFDGDVVDTSVCGNGHINHTAIVTSDSGKRYILQILNTDIFKNPVGVMDNILAVTAHISQKLQEAGEDIRRGTLTPIPNRQNPDIYYFWDSSNNFWRAYEFIEGTVCHLVVDSLATFEKVGYAFGDFQCKLADFDASVLCESIPDFHHTPKRYAHFEQTVKEDPVGRLETVVDIVALLADRAPRSEAITKALATGELPLRVTHNDTKLSNILLDQQTEDCVCIIDLDTIMPGSVLYDFGDAIRSGASTAAEDEQDLTRVHFREDMFKAFAKGFVKGMGQRMTPAEKAMLPMGAWTIIYEQAVRFLDDYLAGDTYYLIEYDTHNLVRAMTQIQLLLELEDRMPDLTAWVETL